MRNCGCGADRETKAQTENNVLMVPDFPKHQEARS
jgi:hypothetical protein